MDTVLDLSPPLDADAQRVAIAVYRTLATGRPATIAAIVDRTRVDQARVEALLVSWPGVFRDDHQRVIGFWGLSIPELGPHRLQVDAVQLSAWCAWDTLFLPELLARPADVRSRSPLDHEPIALRVSPQQIETSTPANLIVSMVPARQSTDFIRTFCHHIHFFASTAEAERWTANCDGALLLPAADAFALGKTFNTARYGPALNDG